MTKHTPSPWKARQADSYEALPPAKCFTIDGAGWANFALIVSEMDNGQDTSEARANIALIEAAPDLLAQLKHAVMWHDQISAADIARYNEAIAKAEGQV